MEHGRLFLTLHDCTMKDADGATGSSLVVEGLLECGNQG